MFGRVAKVLAIGVALALTSGSAWANPEWLEQTWSKEQVEQFGNPAITLRKNGATIVLPAAVFHNAYETGASSQDIALAVLQRYGQCDDELVNLNAPQVLTIRLMMQVDADDSSIAKERAAIVAAQKDKPRRANPDNIHLEDSIKVEQAFVVGPVLIEFQLDYLPPAQPIKCIDPAEREPRS